MIRTNRRIKRLNRAVLTLSDTEPNVTPVGLDKPDFETIRDAASAAENTNQTHIDSSRLLPIDKMVVDLNDEIRRSRRASGAGLFRRFIREVTEGPSQNAEHSGVRMRLWTSR